MTDKAPERLRDDLDEWRARLDHLRVQANLGRMEARDQLREVGQCLEPAWREAKAQIAELIESSASEARTVGKSLLAGWEEVRRKHDELSREAEREPSKPGERG